MEKTGLSGSLSSEQMVPVSSVPAAPGQASPGEGEGKDEERRRPPGEEASAEAIEEDRDQPQHRIDSLA